VVSKHTHWMRNETVNSKTTMEGGREEMGTEWGGA